MSPHARHVSSNKIERVRFTNYQKSAPCQNLIILILSIEEAITQPKMTFLTQKVKVVAMATNHQNVRHILN